MDVMVWSAAMNYMTVNNAGRKTVSPNFVAFKRLIEVGPESSTDEVKSRLQRRTKTNIQAGGI